MRNVFPFCKGNAVSGKRRRRILVHFGERERERDKNLLCCSTAIKGNMLSEYVAFVLLIYAYVF